MAIGVNSKIARTVIVAVGLASTARGQQVIHRESELTGPGGRTIKRDIRVERGPGYIDRKIEIQRPGGTMVRDTRIQTAGGRPPGHYSPGPRYGGPPRGFERPYVPQRHSSFSGLVAAPFFSLFLGNPAPPPPPSVYYYPEPVYIPPPPPVVIYPQPVEPPPVVVQAPPPQPADPFSDALGRLSSHHGNSRRDGALTLGRIGDDRAVGSLIDRLERDGDREVRVAAAWALGEIGDERAALSLQRASLGDRKHEVREAANIAYRKLPRPGQTPDPNTGELPASTGNRAITNQSEFLDPGPSPEARPYPSEPPPPPAPDAGPALEAPDDLSPPRNPY
ncbi:HEAT repeat domain-containing protein [Tundrisphaera lichenicola]|uniref:HEAT repeat domain-containing protein n=1 Tax=Tundrisphaera lichenicola TaxID=2029860 RepID=UPI003EC08DC8